MANHAHNAVEVVWNLIGGIVGEFFRGWKRKVGVLTLVMACVLAMAWLTCLTNPNLINRQFDRMIPYSGGGITLFTDGNRISLVKGEVITTIDEVETVDNSSHPTTLPESDQDASRNDDQSTVGVSQMTVPVRLVNLNLTSIVDIPFWSIVAPLTLVSAFLLRTKPRKSTETTIPEPIPKHET